MKCEMPRAWAPIVSNTAWIMPNVLEVCMEKMVRGLEIIHNGSGCRDTGSPLLADQGLAGVRVLPLVGCQ